MRNVEKERSGLVPAYEAEGLLGVAAGDGVLLHRSLDDLLSAHQGQGNVLAVHVVAVGDAVVGIEALGCRQEIRMVTEMPFPDAAGGVAPLLEHLGDGQLGGIEPLAGGRKENTDILLIDVHVDAPGVAPGHQARA